MIEFLIELVQAIVTVVAGIAMLFLQVSVDLFYRIIDWRPRRFKKPDKPSDAP